MKNKILKIFLLSLSISLLTGCNNTRGLIENENNLEEEVVEEFYPEEEIEEEIEKEVEEVAPSKDYSFIEEAPYPDTLNYNFSEYVEISNYEDLDLSEIVENNVSEEDIDDYMKDILTSYITYENVETESLPGHILNIDYSLSVEEEIYDEVSDYTFELGSDSFVDEINTAFEDVLKGKSKGDIVNYTHSFKDDIPELSGKTGTFTIVINSIKNAVYPELTEEFITTLNPNAKTEADLRNIIKEELTIKNNELNEELIFGTIINQVYERTNLLKENKELYDYFYTSTYNKQLEEVISHGYTLDEYLNESNMSFDEFNNYITDYSNMNTKIFLSLHLIGEELGVEISEEDVENAYLNRFTYYGFDDLESFKEFYGEENAIQYAYTSKVCNILYEMNK